MSSEKICILWAIIEANLVPEIHHIIFKSLPSDPNLEAKLKKLKRFSQKYMDINSFYSTSVTFLYPLKT